MTAAPLHFLFCVNDGYVPFITVTIKSIIENHKEHEVSIHVMSDYISKKEKKLLNECLQNAKCVSLAIYIVDDSILKGLKDTWSIYTWYRILAPIVLSKDIHRILYLDADTIVTGNVSELFELDMKGKAVAGAIDILSFSNETFERCGYDSSKRYICAGVLLMNLDYWREYALTDQMVSWGRQNNNTIIFPDQDTINYLCRDAKIILPMKYGILGVYFSNNCFLKEPYKTQLLECIESPKIIHYAAQAPWKIELAKHPFQYEWEKYNKQLKHPAKRIYVTKGWNFIKMKIWYFLNPHTKPKHLSRKEILRNIQDHDS